MNETKLRPCWLARQLVEAEKETNEFKDWFYGRKILVPVEDVCPVEQTQEPRKP